MSLNWIKRQIASLYRESVAHRVLSRLRVTSLLDDDVSALKNRPLGMFFYNQRALFLGLGLVYLIALGILAWTVRLTAEAATAWLTVKVLWAFWFLDISLTVLLHKSFTRRVASWAADPITYPYAAIFDRYFVIDSCVVLALILVGKYRNLNLDAYVSLLIANTVVYCSAYAGGRKGSRKQILVVVCFQVIITILLFVSHIELREPRVFSLVLGLGAFVGMALVTVFSVLVISWLRTLEHETSELRLRLLANSEQMLAGSRQSALKNDVDKAAYSERQFRDLARQLLAVLCSQGSPFWYHSACLWLLEEHQDRGKREGVNKNKGKVLLPAAWVNFDEANRLRDGLDDADDLLTTNKIIIVPSLKLHAQGMKLGGPRFRASLDGPAAFVPLVRGDREIGVLAVYGREKGEPLLYDDTTFLWGLGSIISNTMEQWEGRYKILPQKEMDELFACSSLDEMFPKAVKTLKKYLEASGCMIIFRPDPANPEMEVRAVNGFKSSFIQRNIYKVGVGQTGKCAELGAPIKWDNVQNHLEEFDDERLRLLQKALGKEILSWMSIPIGPKHYNFGVIKVVNSTGLCPWFTDYDKHLGLLLAQRLQIMIEKFLHIDEIEKQLKEIAASQAQAQLSERDAKVAQQNAEALALQRQDDLTIVTHQLQAPLNSVIGAVTLMQRINISSDRRLDYVRALVEDALALCFGTFTTFAHEAGRETAFSSSKIDALPALRKLAKRLQMTNARDDLRFAFHADPDFPLIEMDNRVFTSVFFSLIHNAMKYAEKYSHVTLECGFERATGRAALKVRSVGEEVKPEEKETIFEKYGRGEVIRTTGRHHSGVGLGLWVARELMRATGGDLTVELSKAQPDLSVFIVYVPFGQTTGSMR